MSEFKVGKTFPLSPPAVEVPLFEMDPVETEPHRPRKVMPGAARVSMADVERVMETWRQVCDKPTAKLTDPRERRIREAIRAYGIDTVLDAVHGIVHSEFHMGRNSRGERYDDITLILRDAKNIEKFAALRPKKRFFDDEG